MPIIFILIWIIGWFTYPSGLFVLSINLTVVFILMIGCSVLVNILSNRKGKNNLWIILLFLMGWIILNYLHVKYLWFPMRESRIFAPGEFQKRVWGTILANQILAILIYWMFKSQNNKLENE